MRHTIPAPRINTNDDQMQLLTWHVGDGTYVEAGQDLADVETSKAVVTVQSTHSGFTSSLITAGSIIAVGESLCAICDTADEVGAERTESASAHVASSTGGQRHQAQAYAAAPVAGPMRTEVGAPASNAIVTFTSTRFSKAAERMLAEKGLRKETFAGRGLITVHSLRSGRGFERRVADTPKGVADTRDLFPKPLRTAPVSLSKQAEIASLSMGESGNVNSLLSVYFDSAPIRERLRAENALGGLISPLILFETSRLLRKWPVLTAYFQDGAINYYDRIDLGVAFDLGKGLKVVTFPEADRLTPSGFLDRIVDVGQRYQENRLRPEELSGSTITVTDLSAFDVLHFHPLINGQQSAIIGIGGDSTRPGHPMTLSVNFDHRILNGRDVASFLRELRDRVLSYTPARAAGNPHPTPAFSGQSSPGKCDRCGIDIATYYREGSRDAIMTACFRADGSVGAVCHLCSGGWTS